MNRAISTVLFLLAASASSTAFARSTTFDLVCTGQQSGPQGGGGPFTDRLSVDLAGRRWCDRAAGCPFVFPIRAEHGDGLQLLAVKTPYNEAEFDVDLKTGAFTRATRIPDRPESPLSAKGVCRPAPFTAIR